MLFFKSDSALAYLDKSDGVESGAGPSVVMLDESMAKTITSTPLTHDYAVIFNQTGLMAFALFPAQLQIGDQLSDPAGRGQW